MLSLVCDVEDDIAIAVQRNLHNLERHISVLQLRKSHYQTSITSFFQPSANLDSEEGSGECYNLRSVIGTWVRDKM